MKRERSDIIEMVCAWCDVSNRVEQVMRVDGRVVQSWTCCAYCGRTELRRGKLGRQTPIPPPPTPPDDDCPF
jgi:hypothetical protein